MIKVYHGSDHILQIPVYLGGKADNVNGNGFTGAMIGVCFQDLQGDGCYADFDWIEYNTEG